HYQLGAESPDSRSVRDCYLQHGLTRNAWRHLMRLPSSVLLHLAIVLALTPQRPGREHLLRELSLALSRLGNSFRYYRLERDRLVKVTTTRDLVELVDKGCLDKPPSCGRSTCYGIRG